MPKRTRISPAANSATTRAFVQWIRSAAPYIHALRGKTLVIAFGGEVVADDTFLGIIHDLNLLHSLGVRLVVVHGSRPQIEAILKQQNIPSRYNRGLRVTDSETLDCVLEGTGHARSRIEALLSLGVANSPMAGARIRVVGGNFITAKPIGVLDGVDMQWTGEVRRVDVEAMRQRLDDGDIVLVSPLGYSPTGEIFNLALEEVATQVAVRMSAHKLIFLMETDGVRNGRRQLLSELSTRDAEALLAHRSKLPRDVRHYLPCAIRACDNGVKRAHLLSRHNDGALLLELFTRDGVGTMIAATPLATPAQRHHRRRRRHPRDHRAARGPGRARPPFARAAGNRNRAVRRRRARRHDHRLRRALRLSRRASGRARGARGASRLPARRLRRGADARDRAARAQAQAVSACSC